MAANTSSPTSSPTDGALARRFSTWLQSSTTQGGYENTHQRLGGPWQTQNHPPSLPLTTPLVHLLLQNSGNRPPGQMPGWRLPQHPSSPPAWPCAQKPSAMAALHSSRTPAKRPSSFLALFPNSVNGPNIFPDANARLSGLFLTVPHSHPLHVQAPSFFFFFFF